MKVYSNYRRLWPNKKKKESDRGLKVINLRYINVRDIKFKTNVLLEYVKNSK